MRDFRGLGSGGGKDADDLDVVPVGQPQGRSSSGVAASPSMT